MEYFILGMAVGIALHRTLMAFVLWCNPDTRCAYCKWKKKGENRHTS